MVTPRLELIVTAPPLLDAIACGDIVGATRLLGGATFAPGWNHYPEAFAWLCDFAKENTPDFSWWNYLLLHKADHKIIGSCGYKGEPDSSKCVEIGYEVAPDYQNRGYGFEAAQALCAHAYQSGLATTVCAHTLALENASVAILRKLHFAFEEELLDEDEEKIWKWRQRLADFTQ
jgi:RimJ/RimL family protein N-acetyltransferase